MMELFTRYCWTARPLLVCVLIIGGCVASAPDGIRAAPTEFTYTLPPETGDGWHTADISDVGLDPEIINKLLLDVRAGDLENIYAVIVAKDGVLVVDEYFGPANRTHIAFIASVTKSLVSLLVGVALEESAGNKGIGTPLRDFFPDYSEQMSGDGKAAIALRHALTMTAGLDWDESAYPHPHERNPNTRMYKLADPVGYILGTDVLVPPGERWNYNSGLSVLLGEVVRSLSGEYIDEFAESRLFEPLGFTHYQWWKHADGTLWANGDLAVRPRDLAKIGQLVLDGGGWRGRQIVSADWIRESTRRYTAAKRGYGYSYQHGYGYGYQWWLGSARYGDRRLDVIFGSGTGGQKLFIVPEVGMVAAVISKVHGNKAGHERATWVLTDYLLPAALPAVEHPPFPLDPALAKAARGKFHNAIDDQVIRIEQWGDTLYVKPTFFWWIELKPLSRTSFQGRWGPIGEAYIDFIENADGDVVAADVHYLLGTRHFRKSN